MIYSFKNNSNSYLYIKRLDSKFELIPNSFNFDKRFPSGEGTYKRVVDIEFRWLFWYYELVLRKERSVRSIFKFKKKENKSKMTREEKVNYLRIALGLQKIAVSNETADRVIETYEQILKLKGEFSIKDAVEIETRMDKKYAKKKIHSEENKS